jgi:hypothetical protein
MTKRETERSERLIRFLRKKLIADEGTWHFKIEKASNQEHKVFVVSEQFGKRCVYASTPNKRDRKPRELSALRKARNHQRRILTAGGLH